MLTVNRNYVLLSILLFAIELVIALFVKDNFVRPYLGDVLVVILIYCVGKSFLNISVTGLAISVLLFAFTIEFLQYLNIVEKLGLENSEVATTVIGTSFAWIDLIAYVAGIGIVVLVERHRMKRNSA